VARLRARIAGFGYGAAVPPPTPAELSEARRHAEQVRGDESELEHPAAGHELDDHQQRDADRVPLRGSGRRD
jgi:hypothetical protein